MAYRGKLDDHGVMEGILDDIKTGGIEFWLNLLARYENEKPGDFLLPGVPPRRISSKGHSASGSLTPRSAKGKKRSRNRGVAA